MRKLLFPLFLIFAGFAAHAQVSLPVFTDSSLFSTYYWQRVTHFATLPQSENDIVFLGNSITDGAEWEELFRDPNIKNRGISGDITAGVINRLPQIVKNNPSKIFLLIGVNDLARGTSTDSIIKNILLTASYIKQESPQTKLFVQSILPVSNRFGKFSSHTDKTPQINSINATLKENAAAMGYTFLDINGIFQDIDEKLDARFTNDGLHLLGSGYLLWQQFLYPYVYDATEKPALIPMPQQVIWGSQDDYFSIFRAGSIIIRQDSLRKEADILQGLFHEMGWEIPIEKSNTAYSIELEIEPTSAPLYSEEVYNLKVDENHIRITANTKHGIFNGIQTLRQLMRNGLTVPACHIVDWPAFAMRGYMIDVGRNFMPMDLLKEQIAVMAKYKLNVFHFHLTEDVAWRLAINQYPQLTAHSTMTRNPGEFYSVEDVKELIAFCKERHITFIPEIDMPGHSAAFTRAMGFDMQSAAGLKAVKQILKEIFETYDDIPYIHIGGDEVKITNKQFLPEVISYSESFGKKVIGWDPGGNLTDDVVRQLWMGHDNSVFDNKKLKFIDSRHLYLNHIDPLETVTTIFFRRIEDAEHGDTNKLGAILCMWPDRRVSQPEDIFTMNAVYPGMATFAERIWRGGGGDKDWTAVIGAPNSPSAISFKEFEDRLIDHKKQYFADLPFPYAYQSDVVWKLYGPFDADDKTMEDSFKKGFIPPVTLSDHENEHKEVGGTIVLRHWWYPLVKGAIENAKENSVVYAHRKIWSDTEGYKDFWIGFNDLSRSPATDSPPQDGWDDKGSEVWVNKKPIAPPRWKRGGQKGDSEIPLVDEGYSYRPPTKILLQKGWNDVLIKAPVGTFQGKDWQNPVKWEFTFIEVK